MSCKYKLDFLCRLKINHTWSTSASCISFLGSTLGEVKQKWSCQNSHRYTNRHDMDANNKGLGQRQSLCAYACECHCPYLCPCPWQLSSSKKIWVFGYNTYWTPLRKIFLCNFCYVYFNKQLSVHALRHGNWNWHRDN